MKIPKSQLKLPPGFKVPDIHDFEADVERLGEDIAEEFKERVTENIEENYYGFPLAPSTIKAKGHSTPLIDTRQLIEAIYRDGTMVSVDDTPRTDSNLTNLSLAIIQEYGTKDKHIPARPVWRNTFEDFRTEAHDMVEEFLRTRKFKDRGGEE